MLVHAGEQKEGAPGRDLEGPCHFPQAWWGKWFQQGFSNPIELNATYLSSQGTCIDSLKEKFIVQDSARGSTPLSKPPCFIYQNKVRGDLSPYSDHPEPTRPRGSQLLQPCAGYWLRAAVPKRLLS
ncbi:unnamed protein product [Cyprideis torosa]|uniref:DUF7044 domain-containing protein n=1 Tax=Cyprideis torosa TaxID=163714 RepID=A0A7R8ZK45_9CRUS|nr:unnamed protein product [Cyprideis torosa]CAG0880962.1 unnamed protein product [Cyprideis torosa]